MNGSEVPAPALRVTRRQALAFRLHAQELIGAPQGRAVTDVAVLDLGVQDTGPDGAPWALALRGAEVRDGRAASTAGPAAAAAADPDLAYAWTLRGAPHAYRRGELAEVAAAVAPWSEADAAKRVFDAARPLRAAGIPVLDALAEVATQLRDITVAPMTKGEVSTQLSRRLPAPYLRECRPCRAVHTYEQPFRLAALQAGLELLPGTSPPVLRRVPGWPGPATTVPERLDPVRGALRFLGPTSPRLVAGFLDAPVREVTARWPADEVVPVEVDGQPCDVLAADVERLADPPDVSGVRLLGPFDLLLQGRDRELVVPDEAARKDLWRTLGRPGGLLVDGELVGSWRPRSNGRRLRLQVPLWSGTSLPARARAGLDEMAERLAAHRGQAFEGYVEE